MGTTYRIAEVAERSGFTASTLRYYETLGLVPPAGRTAAGYRVYDDATLARLAFISRAKQLGCSLDEINDLTDAWDGKRCQPVQVRLRDLIETKISEAQARIAEMAAFTAELQQAAATLGRHTPDGPCDERCGCATAATAEPAIACTLAPSDMQPRLEAWRTALEPVVARTPIDNGVRVVLPNSASLGALVDLVAAEQACCTFFRFAITIDTRGAALEVTAPVECIDVVHSLFGTPDASIAR